MRCNMNAINMLATHDRQPKLVTSAVFSCFRGYSAHPYVLLAWSGRGEDIQTRAIPKR
jgi:hypothetical protein